MEELRITCNFERRLSEEGLEGDVDYEAGDDDEYVPSGYSIEYDYEYDCVMCSKPKSMETTPLQPRGQA